MEARAEDEEALQRMEDQAEEDNFVAAAFAQNLGPPQGFENDSSDSEVDFRGKLLGPSDVEGNAFAQSAPEDEPAGAEPHGGKLVPYSRIDGGRASSPIDGGGEGATVPVDERGERDCEALDGRTVEGASEAVEDGNGRGPCEPVDGSGEGAGVPIHGSREEAGVPVAGGGEGADLDDEPGPSNRSQREDSGSLGSFLRGAKMLARGHFGSPSRGANLDDLSEDLLIKIFVMADLSVRDLCTFSTISRKWKRVCYGANLWERVTLGRDVNNCTLHKIAKRCSNLIELRIEKVQKIHGLRSVFRACGHSLKRLRISWESNSGSGFAFLVLWMVSRDCRELDTVELTSSARSAYSMGLEYGPIWCLTVGCQSMRTFIDYCGRSTTDNTLNLIGRAWKDLTTLAIHGMSFTMRGLIQLRGCTKLHSLEICDGKPGLIGDALEPRQPGFMLHDTLERVTFNRTQLSTEEVKLLCRACPNLKRVEVKALSNTVAGVGEDAQTELQQVKKRVSEFLALNALPVFKARKVVVHAEQ